MTHNKNPKQFWSRHCCMGCLTMSLRDVLIDKGYRDEFEETQDMRVLAVDTIIAKLFGFEAIEQLDKSVNDHTDIELGRVSDTALRVVQLLTNPHVLTLFKVWGIQHDQG